MKHFFYLPAFAIVALLSFNSCLGDKGNITISYGTGTILFDTLSNTPYIRLDDIGLCITGDGVPTLSDSIARAMTNYTVDWDHQSENAQTTGIFEASLSNRLGISTKSFPCRRIFLLSKPIRYKPSPDRSSRTRPLFHRIC